VQSVRNVVEDSMAGSVNVYTTTITVSATRDYGFNGSFLYEVAYYIMPYNTNALLRVYVKKDSVKYYFVGKKGDADDKWKTITKYTGDSDYLPKYLNKTYEQVVLEYRDVGSTEVNEMIVNITDKQVFSEEESDLYDSGEEADDGSDNSGYDGAPRGNHGRGY
jgi:hypothetical protein